MDYKKYNDRVFECMSMYLNLAPTFINEELYKNTGGDALAYSALLAAVCMLDTVNDPEDKLLYMKYFIPMVHKLDTKDFTNDLYYQTVKFKDMTLNKWTLKELVCKPYEAFVCGDPEKLPDGRIIPRIGYFDKEFRYPAVLENGRLRHVDDMMKVDVDGGSILAFSSVSVWDILHSTPRQSQT